MKKGLYLPVGVFVISSMFWGGMVPSSLSTSHSVQAQVNEESRADIKRWEFCSVVPINIFSGSFGKYTGTAMIYYARDGESSPEKVQGTSSASLNKAADSVMAKAVAKLGNEGWEMVGEGTFLNYTSGEQKVLYFKRPIK